MTFSVGNNMCKVIDKNIDCYADPSKNVTMQR